MDVDELAAQIGAKVPRALPVRGGARGPSRAVIYNKRCKVDARTPRTHTHAPLDSALDRLKGGASCIDSWELHWSQAPLESLESQSSDVKDSIQERM